MGKKKKSRPNRSNMKRNYSYVSPPQIPVSPVSDQIPLPPVFNPRMQPFYHTPPRIVYQHQQIFQLPFQTPVYPNGYPPPQIIRLPNAFPSNYQQQTQITYYQQLNQSLDMSSPTIGVPLPANQPQICEMENNVSNSNRLDENTTQRPVNEKNSFKSNTNNEQNRSSIDSIVSNRYEDKIDDNVRTNGKSVEQDFKEKSVNDKSYKEKSKDKSFEDRSHNENNRSHKKKSKEKSLDDRSHNGSFKDKTLSDKSPNKSCKDKSLNENSKDKSVDKDNSKKRKISDSKKPKKKRKVSNRPWRGYTSEVELKDRKFSSVGCDSYYIRKDSGTKANDKVFTTASTKLLQLHRKFILHRLSLDDSPNDPERTDIELVHKSVPHNEPQQDCKCTEKKFGIHHNIYPEISSHDTCNQYTNNAEHLYHYRLVVTPEINFVTRDPTTIYFDGKDFCFEGYSLFTHVPITHIPDYTFMRNCMDHTVKFVHEPFIPKGFCVYDSDLISDFLFTDLFELLDWKHNEALKDCCRIFHFLPRFVHKNQDEDAAEGQVCEMLSMAEVFDYLLDAYKPFTDLEQTRTYETEDWRDLSKEARGCLLLNSLKKPRALRVDAVVIPETLGEKEKAPVFEHTTEIMKSASKEASKEFNELMDQLRKAKIAVRSRSVPRKQDQELLWKLQDRLDQSRMLRDYNKYNEIRLDSEGYMHTGLRWDMCQHASYLPGVWRYLRFMLSLSSIEKRLSHTFKNISLLKTALTHPSYTDQSSLTSNVRTMLQNLGKRHPHVERIRPGSLGVKKKGVMNMTNVMSRLFTETENASEYHNNERLEFLGDAVLDYLTSVHLFFMFPDKGPGKLTAFRSGLVQKDNLVRISKKLQLEKYLLIHHNMFNMNETDKIEGFYADAVEAIIGAVYLDRGIAATDKIIAEMFFDDKEELAVWESLKLHPLQTDLVDGDRHLIERSPTLKRLVELETKIGVQFKHIRLLCKALTHQCGGLDSPTLTGGTYERLEFLGDAILKYVCSDYLYKKFPTHAEGHLTLLRTTFVNMNCLALAAKEIDLDKYIIFQSKKVSNVGGSLFYICGVPQRRCIIDIDVKIQNITICGVLQEKCYLKTLTSMFRYKNDAVNVNEKVICDVFEAFVGAVHCDKGIKYCRKFIEVCILSRLREKGTSQDADVKNQEFLINQEWIDPKTQLQQCCHTLKKKGDKKHTTPVYKKLKQTTEGGIQFFKVAVYFNEKRLGTGTGRSLKVAEKEAAREALKNNHFEQHVKQKRIAYRRFGPREATTSSSTQKNRSNTSTPRLERERGRSRERTHHKRRQSDEYRSRRHSTDRLRHSKHSDRYTSSRRSDEYRRGSDSSSSTISRKHANNTPRQQFHKRRGERSIDNGFESTNSESSHRCSPQRRNSKSTTPKEKGNGARSKKDNDNTKIVPQNDAKSNIERTTTREKTPSNRQSTRNDSFASVSSGSSDDSEVDDSFLQSQNRDSDEGAITLSSGDDTEDEHNDGELYESVFNMKKTLPHSSSPKIN